MELARTVAAQGGAAHRSTLYGLGASRRAIDRALRTGDLQSVGRGGVALPGAVGPAVDAVRHGGRLTCLSWLRDAGVPVLVVPELPHLSAPSHRVSPGVIWHRSRQPVEGPAVVDALLELGRCRPRLEVLAAVDAALHGGRSTGRELAAAGRAHEPAALRWALRHADDRAESAVESALRGLLIEAGIKAVEPQAVIVGVGRVDLLVDGWLVVEADGFAFHGDRTSYRTDRRRGAHAVVAGYVTLGFSYEDVLARPAETTWTVRQVLARRHRHSFRTVV